MTLTAAPPRKGPLDWDANPRRSLVIFSGGAILGLALSGYALFTAKGTVTKTPPPEDVALVNQRPILVSDFDAQVETQFGVPVEKASPAQRRQVLDDMIREELFVQRGLELDMAASDPDVRSALVSAVEQQVSVEATAQSPTPQQLLAFYQANAARYSTEGSMILRDLVFRGPPDTARPAAQAAVAALRGGASPARYAVQDSGAVQGEEFYFAARIHLGPRFDAAAALGDGEVSDPIDAPDGVHVLVMIRNNRPVLQSFEAATPKLLVDYKAATQARLDKGELAYLRDKAAILIAPGYR